VTEAYAAIGIRAEVEPFFDDMPRRLTEAQLVIAAPAPPPSPISASMGRPAIYPLAAATAITRPPMPAAPSRPEARSLMPESKLTPEALAERSAPSVKQPDAAIRMAEAALGVAVPDATERLVALVEELAQPKRKDAA
jgi:UDP-N-acetylglucosamine--N-acetylmuramyl-(pentapeptide) pyrophosphoryl-undecaprenol N-acetylglucosamine transferase